MIKFGKMFFGVVLVTVVGFTSSVMAASDNKGSFFLGAGSMPLVVEGMEDAHVSDWEKFGLGGTEGRMLLGMGEGNIESPAVPGLEFGVTWNLLPALDVGLGVGLFFGDILGGNVSLAADYYVWSNEKMRLGVQASAGVAFGSMSLGTAKILEGKTSPVIIDSDITIYDGDSLTAQVSGFVSAGGVLFEYNINEVYGVRLHAGYQYGALSGGALSIGDGEESVMLELSDPAIVKTDGSDIQAGVSPSGSTIGFVGGIGVVYRTNFES